MTEFEILSAVLRRKGRIMYLELMNIGLLDEKPDGVSDKRKIRALIKEGYLAGETRSEEWIRMTPKGYARMMELEVQEQNRSAAVKPKPRMKLMQRMKNSKLIRAIKHFIASRKEKRLLVSAWKQASEDDREVVVAALRKYGMRYQKGEERMTPINEELLPKDARLLPKEGEEQATLFSWARMQSWRWPELALMFHVPNGGKRNKKEAGRFKAEGVKSGVPDIMLPVARDGYHGLFIELKRLKGGRVEKEQLEWHDKLRAQGYQVVVCRGWQAAAQEIAGYLETGQ